MAENISKLLQQYGCGPIQFSGTDSSLYERHLVFDNVMDLAAADARARFEAFAHRFATSFRNAGYILKAPTNENPKRVYYLSMEFHWAR
jgi:starch phosphorylase